MENPTKMDDLGGPPLFLETPIYTLDSYFMVLVTFRSWNDFFFILLALSKSFSSQLSNDKKSPWFV